MSVSAVSSNPTVMPQVKSVAQAVNARAADGDFKTKNPMSSQVKDSDGDYKPAAAAGAAAKSAASVQSALAILKVGG